MVLWSAGGHVFLLALAILWPAGAPTREEPHMVISLGGSPGPRCLWRPGKMKAAALRLLRGEDGQDLVEYALLAGLIGFAGLLVFDAMLQAMGVTYGSWETGVDNLWDTPGPASGS